MDTAIARKMLRTLEPFHGWIYFAAEAPAAYSKLGITDGRMGYFGSRSAAMGAVGADVVIATFYNFSPQLIRRHIPGVWDITSPSDLVHARFEAADAMLRRILGDAVSSSEMREAAELARRAAEACRPEGRPLYAGHASLPWPDEPHLVLWLAQTLLREFRGDGHIAALTTADLDGCEALVSHAASGQVAADVLRRTRAWTDDEWQAAVERLASRGQVNADGSFTDAGTKQRDEIERLTDELAMDPWNAIGEDECHRLREMVRPWSRTIVQSGGPVVFDLDDS